MENSDKSFDRELEVVYQALRSGLENSIGTGHEYVEDTGDGKTIVDVHVNLFEISRNIISSLNSLHDVRKG